MSRAGCLCMVEWAIGPPRKVTVSMRQSSMGISLFLDIQEFVNGVKLIRILHIYRRVENNDTGYRKTKITVRENFQGVRDRVTSIVPCDHSQVTVVVFCKPMWPMRPMRILDEYIARGVSISCWEITRHAHGRLYVIITMATQTN